MSVRRVELRVDVSHAVPFADAELAVSLILPGDGRAGARFLAVGFPGGGYARGYWDIQWPGVEGYSEAEYHVDRGWVFAAIDHLGVGDSSHPDPEALTLEVLAAANAAGVRAVVDGLRAGTLVDGIAPIEVARTIGMGQSMGGCFTIVAQALHTPFDAIAVLGYSGIHTVLPSPDGAVVIEPDRLTGDVFTWAFHWEDVDPALLEADFAGGYPFRTGTPPPWGSLTVPPAAISLLTPGVVATEAAAVTVPVFVGAGERDVVPDPWAEPCAYRASRDITVVVVPQMAHMHNFAGTREQLWRRLHGWATTV